MNHPLTDDIIESELATPAHFTSGSLVGLFTHDDMRATADWQLEQVIEWIRGNLMKHDFHEGYAYLYDDCSNAEIEVDLVVKDLKKAMRPQEES